MVCLALGSCGNNELLKKRGVVVGLELRPDSGFTLHVLAGTDSLLFKLDDAHFVNGSPIPGDSVIIDYIKGRRDTLRALVVTVHNNLKPSRIIELGKVDPNAELITAPDSISGN